MALAAVMSVTLAPVLLMVPVGALLVFGLEMDRLAVANAMCVAFTAGLYATFAAPVAVLPGPMYERLRTTIRVWLWVAYVTACTWELGWLIFREPILRARNEAWAYAWW